MPPDAFMFETSGQLVMQTAIGGAGTLFGPLLGAIVWLYLQDFLQTTLNLGASWKLVLGIIFVLLVCFLRHGLIGGIKDLYDFAMSSRARRTELEEEAPIGRDGGRRAKGRAGHAVKGTRRGPDAGA